MDKNAEYPPIEEIYTSLFEKERSEEYKREQQTQKSINNFLNAAIAINKLRAAEKEKEEVNS